MKVNVAAVIVAAGSSRRMGASCKDKLMLKINGAEVLARTMLAYQKASTIDKIYVVTSAHNIDAVKEFAVKYGIEKFGGVCKGGETRQLSVQAGLSLCENADYVAIADGARPFVSPQDIDRVNQAAAEHDGAVLCVPVKDTIKVLSPDGTISHTPPRAALLAAQTPQTFRREVFAPLLARAISEGKEVTDDCSVYEIYGLTAMPVIGSYDNIKITTAEDINWAQAIAGKEQL